MNKAIFIIDKLTEEKINQVIRLGTNAIFIGHQNLEQNLVNKLKKRNIKVISEVGIFVGNELWQKYPDSRPKDRNDRPIGLFDWYAGVCPNHPKVRKEKLRIIKSIIKNYDIDGIWLDFIRYPCHWEDIRSAKITEYCFCPACLRRFLKEIGDQPQGNKWIQWKCRQIENFIEEVRNLIDKSNEKIDLGLFAVPWKEKDFNGAIKKIVCQDFASLAKYIDIFTPMVYQKFCDKQVSWIHNIVKDLSKITNKPVIPIVQTEDRAGKISPEEFTKEIETAIKLPSEGVIVFFLEDLLKDRKKVEIVERFFK